MAAMIRDEGRGKRGGEKGGEKVNKKGAILVWGFGFQIRNVFLFYDLFFRTPN